MDPGVNDRALHRQRFPTLTPAGQRMLDFMREHPCAPIYRNSSGNRLLAHEVDAVHAFERKTSAATVGWPQGILPAWLMPFVAATFSSVPHYRALGSPPLRFTDIAPICRADLAADVAQFVPDHVDADRLINFRTTGTTGHPLLIASHPLVAARYAAFHKRALRRVGIEPRHGSGRVGVVLLGYQRRCFTYVSVTPTMGESGLAKINLHPADWRHPDDRARYLDALAPEIVAGDPISFSEYLELPLTQPPSALISVSMLLHAGLRERLERRFGCPVLDIYSLNEVGPVGVFDAAAGGHLLLQPRLYVEILDRAGHPVAPGARGEIGVTGGFNFCLPLLRYRTGDFAALSFGPEGPVLVGLSGRRPVRFFACGAWINNIDITHVLRPLAISHFTFHQRVNGEVILGLAANSMSFAPVARAALAPLFGEQSVRIKKLGVDDKTLQYTSELAGAHT